MTVCAHRRDTPGMFTPCNGATKDGRLCAKQVRDEEEC